MDIRVPEARPIKEKSINFPPQILRNSVLPSFGVTPIYVGVGEACESTVFFSPLIRDLDLKRDDDLFFEWRLQVQVKNQDELPAKSILNDLKFITKLDDSEDDLRIFNLEINRQNLIVKLQYPIERLIGQTHRLELHVSDNQTGFSSISTTDPEHEDSIYWLLTFTDDCEVQL